MNKRFRRSGVTLIASMFILSTAIESPGAGSPLRAQEGKSTPNAGARSAVQGFSSRERAALTQKLGKAPEVHLQFENARDSAVSISDVRARVVEVEFPAPAAGSAEALAKYVMDAEFIIFNGSDESVTTAVFQVNSPDWRILFYSTGGWTEPSSIVTNAHATRTYAFQLMSFPQDPSNLVVRLIGVKFKSGSVWGQVPANQGSAITPVGREPGNLRLKPVSEPIRDPALSPSAATSVDSKPVLVTRPQPLYTEVARVHRVFGQVQMRILIDSEGNVTKTQPFTFLPDFLTDQAIQAALGMKFKPAVKAGVPVAYWVLVDVEFSIR